MSLLNQVFQGNPNLLGLVASGGEPNAPNVGIDTVNGAIYESAGSGWTALGGALVNKTVQTSITAEAATVTFPVARTGLYTITVYEVSTTATAGTLPAETATWTDADSGVASTSAFLADKATAAAGIVNTGTVTVNALAGTNIVLTASSFATATYTIKTRIQFLG
jgi:hypothetical protein